MIFFSSFGFRGFEGLNLSPKVSKDAKEESKEQDIFSKSLQQPPEDIFKKSPKRINDLDTNIFVPENFIPDDSLRLGLKIEKSEKNIKKVENEIETVNALDFDNKSDKLSTLEEKKQLLHQEMQGYKEEYKSLGPAYQISEAVCSFFDKSKTKLKGFKVAFTSNATVTGIKRLIPGMKQREELSSTLNKFCQVHSNISGLLSTTANPFGDAEKWMQDYVSYMNAANKLESKSNKIIDHFRNTKSVVNNFFNNIGTKIKSGIFSIRNSIMESVNSFKNALTPRNGQETQVLNVFDNKVQPIENQNLFNTLSDKLLSDEESV